MDINDTSVEVLYDFEYPLPKSGKIVSIREGERLFLIKKTNDDWWQVIRSNERRPFYVPSTYVREILPPPRRSSTNSLGRAADRKFTVSVNINQKPVIPVVAKPRTSKSSANCSDVKVGEETDKKDNRVIDANELSDNCDKKAGGYSVVRVKKSVPEYGEANILEEEQQLSESLTELARQITFRPARCLEHRRDFMRRLDGLKYGGSFKTKHERKKILDKQISGSWPDLTVADRAVVTKSAENLESDPENNLFERPPVTVVTFPGNSSSTWRQDDSDSERLGSDITESSCESLNPSKYKPVAKPRKIFKPQQGEVIYANCLELRALENEEDSKETIQEPDPVKETSDEADTNREVVKETAISGDIFRDHIEISKEFIKDLELKTAQLSSRQQRTSSGEFEEEKGQIEQRSENEKSSEDNDWGRKFFKREKKRKSSEKEYESKADIKGSKEMTNSPDPKETPLGWTTQVDTETQLPCYIHSNTGKKINEELTAVLQKISSPGVEVNRRLRSMKAVSMIVPDKRAEAIAVNKEWPQLSDGKICVLLEGPLNYRKINEGGKKGKKGWCPAYGVLTELLILIYKDIKAFRTLNCSPEVSIDLNGASIGNGDSVSNKKHVLLIKTQLALDVALLCDNGSSAIKWATSIMNAIKHLPKGSEMPGVKYSGQLGDCPEEPRKGSSAISRSKSVNFKNKDDSMEDLGSTPAERQMKIKDRLLKFFIKRPPVEQLVKKGIWKDEPVFGCFLEQACGNNHPRVPPFVQKCIAIIETEENMKTDGLYRASGNLSQIQKIRLQIDQHKYGCLEQEEDVHVLTGALKLFFRELKEPLIPYKLFPRAIQASMIHEKKTKIKYFQEIVKSLPAANRDTLKCLLHHLLKVSEYKESNRMHINNVAIVFGPTLMWPEHESANMALDMMQQNMVIEALLNDFDSIFK